MSTTTLPPDRPRWAVITIRPDDADWSRYASPDDPADDQAADPRPEVPRDAR